MNQRRRGIHGEIIEPVTLMQEPTYRTSSEGSGGACFDAGPARAAIRYRLIAGRPRLDRMVGQGRPKGRALPEPGGDKEGGVPYPPETGILRRVLESDASHNPPVPDDNGVYCGSIRTSSL
ncbi:MAG: hypothetical protein LUP97_00485 [Methanoregula sp.]|nr:hypothetical protein [Methanoregula sp.]